jgi:hypothetical protein
MIGERHMAGDAFGPHSHYGRCRVWRRRILGADLEDMGKLLL